MEVVGITGFFFTLVAGAVALSGYLLSRAVARDRADMLAAGELQLQSPAAVEDEVVAAWGTVDPVGTLALMLVYLMVLIGLWVAMYAILLARD
jgi:hypothetical protein